MNKLNKITLEINYASNSEAIIILNDSRNHLPLILETRKLPINLAEDILDLIVNKIKKEIKRS